MGGIIASTKFPMQPVRLLCEIRLLNKLKLIPPYVDALIGKINY